MTIYDLAVSVHWECRRDLAGHLCKVVVKVSARVAFSSGGLNREGSRSLRVLVELISLQV